MKLISVSMKLILQIMFNNANQKITFLIFYLITQIKKWCLRARGIYSNNLSQYHTVVTQIKKSCLRAWGIYTTPWYNRKSYPPSVDVYIIYRMFQSYKVYIKYTRNFSIVQYKKYRGSDRKYIEKVWVCIIYWVYRV